MQAGLRHLADELWQQETEARQRFIAAQTARLEPPTYDQLFGVQPLVRHLMTLAREPDGPRLILLAGVGGLGKTSLADHLSRSLIAQRAFDSFGWVSLRPQISLWDARPYFQTTSPRQALESLFETLARQLLGAIAYDRRQWPQSIAYFQQGAGYWQKSGEEEQMAKALVNMGLAEAKHNRPLAAETHYRQAIALLETLPAPQSLATIYMNLGQLLTDEDQPEAGLRLLQQAESIFRTLQDQVHLAMVATNMGRAYYGLQRWPQAIHAFETGRARWQALDRPAKALNAAAGLAAAWARAGDFARARALVRASQDALPALSSSSQRLFLQDVFRQVQEMIEKEEASG